MAVGSATGNKHALFARLHTKRRPPVGRFALFAAVPRSERPRHLWRAKEQATEAAAVTCKTIATTRGRAACADGERAKEPPPRSVSFRHLRRLCCLLALWLGRWLCCRWPPPVACWLCGSAVGSVPMAAACCLLALWLGSRLCCRWPPPLLPVACGSALGLCADGRHRWRATYGGEKKVHHFLWDCCTLTFQGGYGNCDLWGFSTLWAAVVVPMGVVYADKKIHNTNRQVGLMG